MAIIASAAPLADAGAQAWGSLDASAARATYQGYLVTGAYTLTPAVGYAGGPVSTYADAALTKFTSGNTSEFVELGGAYGANVTSAVSLVGRIDGSSSWYRDYEPVSQGLAGVRALVRVNDWSGTWIGGAGGLSNAPLGGTDAVHAVGRGDAGGWIVAKPFALIGSVTATAAGDSTYLDAIGTLRFDIPRLSVSGSVGARAGALGGGVPRWAQADVRVPLVSTVSLIGAIGTTPTDIVRGLPGAQYASVGMRIALGRPPGLASPATATSARRENPVAQIIERSRTVEIHEPSGSRVEIMGDFTEWRPVLCPEITPGVFALAVPRVHGVYRIDVRVDGGPWTVPPGLTAVPDDFGGEAGLLVVP